MRAQFLPGISKRRFGAFRTAETTWPSCSPRASTSLESGLVSMPVGISQTGTRLMLHLMKSSVPNGPLLLCQTDQQLIQLAVNHGVPIPMELMMQFASSTPEMILLPVRPVGLPPSPPPVELASPESYPSSPPDSPPKKTPARHVAEKLAAASAAADSDIPSARKPKKPKKVKGSKKAKAGATGADAAEEGDYSIDRPPQRPKRVRPAKKRAVQKELEAAEDEEMWRHTPRTTAALM